MRCGDGCHDVLGTLAWAFTQERFDAVELVSDVFELFVEVFSVVGEPVPDRFEQIPREVGTVAVWVAVCCDVVEPLVTGRVSSGRDWSLGYAVFGTVTSLGTAPPCSVARSS